MIAVNLFGNRPVAVLGLGKAGLAACRALKAGGAEVLAWDDSPAARLAVAVEGFAPVDPVGIDWSKVAALVLSPGVPHTHPKPHPACTAAKAAGCPIVGEVELLYRTQIAATFVGITGTNGKSTTTALIGHILEGAGRRVQVGANLGTPALALEPLADDGIYVLEMSSYQLELTERTIFDVAVMLNITPDHLDRHGGMAGYIAAKERIFLHQDEDCTAVLGVDDADSRALADRLAGPAKVLVSAAGAPASIRVQESILYDERGPVADLTKARALPGAHNGQNAAAAFAACRALGIAQDAIVAGLLSYPGLAHRQELVAIRNGVRYVNDSKATNADATLRALSSYSAIYWIVGGRPKETGLSGVEPFLPRVCRAFLIGEAEADFARFLDGQVSAVRCGTLERAVAEAHAAAQKDGLDGAVVLLSPACASFDQFKNFEERGAAFRRLVEALP
ncbi:MAG: UDP-N-acetylmuramoyl-L-alanine--D-glutamate ligase [Magnetospirillum sp. WYHS-4]